MSDASHDDPDEARASEGKGLGHGEACQGHRDEHGHDRGHGFGAALNLVCLRLGVQCLGTNQSLLTFGRSSILIHSPSRGEPT